MINETTTLILKLSIPHFYMVMFLALHPMKSISLSSFVLLQGEHSTILSTFIKLFNICHQDLCFVYFEWSLKTGFTVFRLNCHHYDMAMNIVIINSK